MTLLADETEEGTLGKLGLETRDVLKGNFEITAGYEILKARDGGFDIFFYCEPEGVGFSHFVLPSGTSIYGHSRATINKDGKSEIVPALDRRNIPARAMSGQLRVARVGSKVVLSAADRDGKEFTDLYGFDLGTKDVTFLRLGASRWEMYPGSMVDLRLREVRLRGLEVPKLPGEKGSGNPPAEQGSSGPAGEKGSSGPTQGLWLLAVGAGIILFGCFVWLRKRRPSRDDNKSMPPSATPG